MKLVLGFDGSACAAAALADLCSAGLASRDVEAAVVCAADCSPHLPASCYLPVAEPLEMATSTIVSKAHALAEQVLADARRTAAAAANQHRRHFPGWTVRSEALAGDASEVILNAAEECRADLIVLGSHGRSVIGRLLLGSVTDHVLAQAACSVRVGRRSPRRGDEAAMAPPRQPPRLIVAIDGFPAAAERVVEAVAQRAWPSGTAARVVTAVDRATIDVPDDSPRHRRRQLAGVRDVVKSAVASLQSHGLVCDHVLRQEDPASLLIDEADRWPADCIFMGATGGAPPTLAEKYLIGSVASTVAARASCSVEVIRARAA
jgi:nucleotide-binding universal stress UspA family protein